MPEPEQAPTRRAYLVVGPESSGNRYMVAALVSAGCAGRADHAQPWDGPDFSLRLPDPPPDRLALHRSVPHGGTMPEINLLVAALRRAGYHATLVVMVRDGRAVERSQVSNGHALSTAAAQDQIRAAYGWIGRAIGQLRPEDDLLFVTYGRLGRRRYRAWLRERLRLPAPITAPFVDGNTQYDPDPETPTPESA